MTISVTTSIPGMASRRSLLVANKDAQTATRRLATGLRVNSGRDDPAGLIASENLRSVLARLDAESRSLERASSYAASADGTLGQAAELMARGAAIEVAEANTAGMSDAEAEAYRMERASLSRSVDHVFQTATFAGRPVFNGEQTLRAGGDDFTIPVMNASELGVSSAAQAGGGGVAFRAAAAQIASVRGALGSFVKNTVEPQMTQVAVERENVSAADSVIRDANFAAETAALSRAQALGGASMFAAITANTSPERALGLLTGSAAG